ncbi:DCL family protein [Bradyrhizobium elkanii]|uniref:DCL family protein n=1 Tax=Bradyrhizobium elkanii TaxID=29448 RepID=UPI0022279C75|nr:DCL family protein [Bradyrhizobium elkanii]MCS3444985.1 hypothetical protein [Bradyrhizobium elkanii]MCS3563887.1 hypothetical protein [Bradyrhizobium elkanii]MCW2146281.1 hypothetical protein [Bradyrhizobium elkanii]MCW2354646.1 hypothetical protein [Bradyrhizobium elkanii]MCW2379108.1 hypothetical protein [Bradyrhizobium elkanii]
MAKAKPLQIGSLAFPTQQKALLHCKNILSEYGPDEWVSEEDALFLSELLKRHPDAAAKIGNGIHHFEVMRASEFNTKCFAIVRRDGSRIDFSYKVCVNPSLAG